MLERGVESDQALGRARGAGVQLGPEVLLVAQVEEQAAEIHRRLGVAFVDAVAQPRDLFLGGRASSRGTVEMGQPAFGGTVTRLRAFGQHVRLAPGHVQVGERFGGELVAPIRKFAQLTEAAAVGQKFHQTLGRQCVAIVRLAAQGVTNTAVGQQIGDLA